MGFWGMSKEGKEAKKKLGEKAASDWAQSQEWSKKAQGWGQAGDVIRDWGTDYYKRAAGEGIGPVSDIRATGQEIMPGIDEAIARRAQILQEMQADVGGTYGRVAGREDTASGDILGNIEATYPGLREEVTAGYGGARERGAEAYRGLKGSAEGTFDTAFKDIEQLRPGGEFAAARSARAFAPAKAAAAGRLRRAGIDPSSPQAQSVLQGVETARARAMDDAMAEGIEKYVGAKTNLGLERQAARERLGLGEVGYDTDLMREQGALERGYTETGAGLKRGETLRHAGTASEIDLSRMADEQTMRQAQAQEELLKPELKAGEFGAGLNFRTADLAERSKAARELMGIGEGQYSNMFGGANVARGYGESAGAGYGDIYNREKASSGWGLKLLGGLGMTALNAATGGMGGTVGSAIGKAATGWGSKIAGKLFNRKGGDANYNPWANYGTAGRMNI